LDQRHFSDSGGGDLWQTVGQMDHCQTVRILYSKIRSTKMKKNISKKERFFRITIAVIFIILSLTRLVVYPEIIPLGIVTLIFIATATFGHCPMYQLFGINTKDKRKYS
jgi:hypothetical protein